MASDFHEVRFPLDVGLGSRGGPVRRTDIVTLASGREHRNSRWAGSRRRYDAGLGVRTARCAACGDRLLRGAARAGSTASASATAPTGAPARPRSEPTPLDQRIGTGDGAERSFPLVKDLRRRPSRPTQRPIVKPVGGTRARRGRTASSRRSGAQLQLRSRDRPRDLRRRAAARRRHHRGLRLRRAGALRHGRARHRPLRLRRRRHPADPADRDRSLRRSRVVPGGGRGSAEPSVRVASLPLRCAPAGMTPTSSSRGRAAEPGIHDR